MKKHEFRRTFYQSSEKRLYLQHLLPWADDGNRAESDSAAGICVYSSIYLPVFPVADPGKQKKQIKQDLKPNRFEVFFIAVPG